jgi:hypothetical protein
LHVSERFIPAFAVQDEVLFPYFPPANLAFRMLKIGKYPALD